MKICVVTPLFAIAGVPLAQVRFARALADKGHDVDLVIGRIHQDYQFPKVTGFKVLELERDHVRSMVLPLRDYLRSAKPDVVFSAEDHLNAVVLLSAILAGSKARISGSSRVTPFDTYSNKPFSKRWVLKHFVRSLMWRANALTCVSKDMVEQYRKVFKSPPHVCVYNIVDDLHSRKRMEEPVEHEWFSTKEGPVLVAAGRLAPWKGFADLIRAMKLIPAQRRARLMILGDGPLRGELQALISELGLDDTVRLLGYVENPLKYFARADVFVLVVACRRASECLGRGHDVRLHAGFHRLPDRSPRGSSGWEIRLSRSHARPGCNGGWQSKRLWINPIPKQLLAEAVRPFEEGSVLKRHFEVLGLPEH